MWNERKQWHVSGTDGNAIGTAHVAYQQEEIR